MAQLTIQNFKKQVSEETLKKAAQNVVRECDEIEKGHFQAYVDQAKVTYDVFIHINDKGAIIGQGCDCMAEQRLCRHKAALILFIMQGKSSVVPKKVSRKKLDPLDELVDAVDARDLKVWLKALFAKNKDIGLAFTHHFSGDKITFNPGEVRQITQNAVKAVVKNKKNLEVGEVKRIVELFTQVHEPILSIYYTQVSDLGAFNNFDAVLDSCLQVQQRINTSSNRILKYVESLCSKLIEQLNVLKDEVEWDLALDHVIPALFKDSYTLRREYLSLLSGIHQASTIDRRKRLCIKMMAKPQFGNYYGVDVYTEALFNMVANSGLFEDYYQLFKPLHFKNEYNLNLIGLLIEYDKLEIAETFCMDQINKNFREEYDSIYLECLAEIYRAQGQDQKLAWVMQRSFTDHFFITDYLFVIGYMHEEAEKKKWRTSVLSKARQVAPYHFSAQLFTFQLMDYESNYAKMIDFIDDHTHYDILVEYGDQLLLRNKNGFLRKILYRSDGHHIHFDAGQIDKLLVHFEMLKGILLKHCTESELKLMVAEVMKQYKFGGHNSFVRYLAEGSGGGL